MHQWYLSYDGKQNALNDVSLTVNRGEHLAIVGPNGGGKSTLINLLCRFYDPQQGEVLIDGISLRDLPLRDVRQKIALVTQQTELFNETILHNIRYGRWDATEEEVFEPALNSADEDGLLRVGGSRFRIGKRRRIAWSPSRGISFDDRDVCVEGLLQARLTRSATPRRLQNANCLGD